MRRRPWEGPPATEWNKNPQLSYQFCEQAIFHPMFIPLSFPPDDEKQKNDKKHYKLGGNAGGSRFAFEAGRHW